MRVPDEQNATVLGCLVMVGVAVALIWVIARGCSSDTIEDKASPASPGTHIEDKASPASPGAQKEETRFIGSDPRAFQTAQEMYATRPVQVFDNVAEDLISHVSVALKEAKQAWQLLIDLNPYRGTDDVQRAVPGWVSLYAASINKESKTAESPALRNDDYVRGDFVQASRQYKDAIMAAPFHYDARNNLALAQMHVGHDLLAEVELLTILALKPDYLPAMVNLTVVYERLGMTEDARKMASQARTFGSKVPSAVFNAAWYANMDGRYDEAATLLDPLVKEVPLPGYKTLQEANAKKVGHVSSAPEKR